MLISSDSFNSQLHTHSCSLRMQNKNFLYYTHETLLSLLRERFQEEMFWCTYGSPLIVKSSSTYLSCTTQTSAYRVCTYIDITVSHMEFHTYIQAPLTLCKGTVPNVLMQAEFTKAGSRRCKRAPPHLLFCPVSLCSSLLLHGEEGNFISFFK